MKDLLERSRENGWKQILAFEKDFELIFPELKESEDEEIRKWIIKEIKIKHHNLDADNVDFVDKAISWLEKQGEHKHTDREKDFVKSMVEELRCHENFAYYQLGLCSFNFTLPNE